MKLKVLSEDFYGEKTENIYEAKKTLNNLGIRYEYLDENSKNDVYILENKVIFNRKGQITTKQIFELGKKTESVYKTPYLTMDFQINTIEFLKSEGETKLEYEIFSNGEFLNKLKIEFHEN